MVDPNAALEGVGDPMDVEDEFRSALSVAVPPRRDNGVDAKDAIMILPARTNRKTPTNDVARKSAFRRVLRGTLSALVLVVASNL